jgi:hypothetical protein
VGLRKDWSGVWNPTASARLDSKIPQVSFIFIYLFQTRFDWNSRQRKRKCSNLFFVFRSPLSFCSSTKSDEGAKVAAGKYFYVTFRIRFSIRALFWIDDGRWTVEEIENENIHTITEVEYVPQFARYIGSLFSREKQIQRILNREQVSMIFSE